MKILSLVLVVSLLSLHVHAEPSKTPIRVAVAAYLTASAADAVTTGLALSQHPTATEANPLFSSMSDQPWTLAAVRMGLGAVLAYGLYKAYPTHPKFVLTMLWIGTSIVSVVAVQNMRFVR